MAETLQCLFVEREKSKDSKLIFDSKAKALQDIAKRQNDAASGLE